MYMQTYFSEELKLCTCMYMYVNLFQRGTEAVQMFSEELKLCIYM